MGRGQHPLGVGLLTGAQPDPPLKFRNDDYNENNPAADKVLLIIESDNSCVAYDRDTKSSLYAIAGVFGSERLTGALLDRVTHHVHILEMNGDSYRLKGSRQNTGSPCPDQPAAA